jgi:hypothetical protein
MTQPIQTLATNCQIISKGYTGYGQYQICIKMYTNIGIFEIYNYTTHDADLIENLKDDNIYIVNSAKESLMDLAMRSVGIEKSNDFQYIY